MVQKAVQISSIRKTKSIPNKPTYGRTQNNKNQVNWSTNEQDMVQRKTMVFVAFLWKSTFAARKRAFSPVKKNLKIIKKIQWTRQSIGVHSPRILFNLVVIWENEKSKTTQLLELFWTAIGWLWTQISMGKRTWNSNFLFDLGSQADKDLKSTNHIEFHQV